MSKVRSAVEAADAQLDEHNPLHPDNVSVFDNDIDGEHAKLIRDLQD